MVDEQRVALTSSEALKVAEHRSQQGIPSEPPVQFGDQVRALVASFVLGALFANQLDADWRTSMAQCPATTTSIGYGQ